MESDNTIDARLVEAYKAGDAKALASLVKRWHVVLCQKSYWIVKDAELSKDIAQETWQVVINKIETLNDNGSFGNWALRIVYSKSFDALRRKRKERDLEAKLGKNLFISEAIYDENTALKMRLLKAISSLSEQQQMIIKFFYTEGYSLKEISETLNISIGTVKSRLFHAREKLKLILKANNKQ